MTSTAGTTGTTGSPGADQRIAPDPGAPDREDAVTGGGSGGTGWFRPDIDGLRALAILVVVAYHAGVPGFSGGFVGVDVFFVISGFLITTKLVHETDRTGRVRLGDFWAKRVRRLVPAMTAMVVVTLGLALVVLSPREWPNVARSGGAAALYVSNIVFATGTTAYFGAPTTENPFLHTWSLGVEEQFYLVWPVLISLACLVARRTEGSRRRNLAVVLGFVGATSLIVSIGLTNAANRWGFFGLQSRAWQFALAGLTALVVLPGSWRRAATATAATVVGLVMIGVAVVTFAGSDNYPGLRALLPTVGTVLVILGGQQLRGARGAPVSDLLAHPSLQWLGRVSYSWYLWHWPFMVFASALLVSESPAVRLPAGILALGVAAVLYARFENPIRHSAVLRRSAGRTFAMAAGATALSLLVATGVWLRADAARAWPETLAFEAVNQANEYFCPQEVTDPSGVTYCQGGAPDGSRTVVLTGDSHAGMWMSSFGAAAADADIRLVSRWQAACPAIPVRITTPIGPDRDCASYQQDTATLVAALRPDLVVVTQAAAYQPTILGAEDQALTPDQAVAEWRDAYRSFVTTLTDQGVRVAAIVDTPRFRIDPLACLARPGGSDERCAEPEDEAFSSTAASRAVEAEVRERLGVPTLDLTDRICDGEVCHVVDDGRIVFADGHHLTDAWTNAHRAEVTAFLEDALAGAGGSS